MMRLVLRSVAGLLACCWVGVLLYNAVRWFDTSQNAYLYQIGSGIAGLIYGSLGFLNGEDAREDFIFEPVYWLNAMITPFVWPMILLAIALAVALLGAITLNDYWSYRHNRYQEWRPRLVDDNPYQSPGTF